MTPYRAKVEYRRALCTFPLGTLWGPAETFTWLAATVLLWPIVLGRAVCGDFSLFSGMPRPGLSDKFAIPAALARRLLSEDLVP